MLELISFGHLHGPAPQADRVEDVRGRLSDPAAARKAGILDLDGRDPRVKAVVSATPGAEELINELVAYAESSNPTRIAIGCAGGEAPGSCPR